MARVNRQWVLRQRPKGLVKPGDLELVEAPVPALNESEVLVRTIYLSLDPTNRTWMNDAEGYLPPVPLGGVMRGLTLGVVEESRSSRFRVGGLVVGRLMGHGGPPTAVALCGVNAPASAAVPVFAPRAKKVHGRWNRRAAAPLSVCGGGDAPPT